MPITISADRRSSRRPSQNNTASSRFDAREHRLLAGGITELSNAGEYKSPLRRLHPSDPAEMEIFQPEYTILTVILRACSRRLEAERHLGILKLPSLGPLDLASVLASIRPKDLDSGHRATPRPPGLFRSSCQGDRALIVSPLDPPQNRNRIGRSHRGQSRLEGGHANASQI